MIIQNNVIAPRPALGNANIDAMSALTKTDRALLIALVAGAILIRIGFVLFDHPHSPGGDEPLFIEIARSIVNGQGVSYQDPRFPCLWTPGMPTASRAPGASFWLAGWFWLIGENLLVPRLVVAIFSGLCAYLLFDIGRRLHSKQAGFISALLWATSVTATITWYGVTSVIAEPLTLIFLIFALHGLVVAVQTESSGWATSCGLAIGVATLLRPTSLTLLAFVFLWAFFFSRRRRTIYILTIALLTQFIAVLPWALRNYLQLGAFTPVSTYAGTNFYISNNPICTANKGAINQGGEPFEAEAIADMKKLPEVLAERYAWKRGIGYLADNPNVIPYLTWRRLLLFWDPSINLASPFDSNQALFDGGYLLLLLLAIVCFYYFPRQDFTWLGIFWCFNFFWINLLISAHPRYRQLADPAFFVLAGVGAAEVIHRFIAGRKIIAALAVGAILLTVFSAQVLNILRGVF